MLIKLKDKEYNEQELEVLAKAGVLQIAEKNDPASTSLVGTPALHGPLQGNSAQFGIFSGAGVRPDRFSALTRPNSWLSIIQVNRSNYTNELLEIATGQTADGTSNATSFCGTPPVAGKLKVCRQQFTWGDFYGATRLNALPLVGQRRDRADLDARVLNAAASQNPFIPDELKTVIGNSQLGMELYNFGVGLERSTEVVSVRGTASVDNSRFGWFHEFAGIAGQIKTGYTDSVTSVTCPAADSVVESFNNIVTGNHNDGSGRNITSTFFDLVYALEDRARQVGMEGTQWAIVMRQELFRVLVEQIANNYNFYQVTGAQYAERNSTADRVQELRREMMQNRYLLGPDGLAVPVVFSEGCNIATAGNNLYISDLYMLPVSWNGLPLIRLEYFPMDNADIREFTGFNGVQTINSINNGMMLVGQAQTPLCLEYHFAARMRVILELPFLAGRIDDIRYQYFAKTRQALPGSSLYQDGGVSAR